MSRGKKLDLNIGSSLAKEDANGFEDEWKVVDEKKVLSKRELLEPAKHQLVFKFEKRRGKPVTLIGPISLKKEETAALLKKIKKSLGSGGSYKEDFMEFQGDCKERLRLLFAQEGFRFKK